MTQRTSNESSHGGPWRLRRLMENTTLTTQLDEDLRGSQKSLSWSNSSKQAETPFSPRTHFSPLPFQSFEISRGPLHASFPRPSIWFASFFIFYLFFVFLSFTKPGSLRLFFLTHQICGYCCCPLVSSLGLTNFYPIDDPAIVVVVWCSGCSVGNSAVKGGAKLVSEGMEPYQDWRLNPKPTKNLIIN